MGKLSPTKIQAKHIPAGMLVDLIRQMQNFPDVRVRFGVMVNTGYKVGPTLYDIAKVWHTVPIKVIQAKLRKLTEKYHILEGCACGCSSGFTIVQYAPYEIRAIYTKDGRRDVIVKKEFLHESTEISGH